MNAHHRFPPARMSVTLKYTGVLPRMMEDALLFPSLLSLSIYLDGGRLAVFSWLCYAGRLGRFVRLDSAQLRPSCRVGPGCCRIATSFDLLGLLSLEVRASAGTCRGVGFAFALVLDVWLVDGSHATRPAIVFKEVILLDVLNNWCWDEVLDAHSSPQKQSYLCAADVILDELLDDVDIVTVWVERSEGFIDVGS